MSKILIIVESPSKCKKIEQYLGSEYKVIASYGHFTKLDSLDQIHFDTFQISYKIDKSKVLKTIKQEIKTAKEVILATDDDREGEAIAWSLCIFCKLNIQKTKKIVFQEITKSALMESLKNIKHLNMDRVYSQQARQILDIYLGYKISPLLWKYVQHTLSAGRCQTPALRLIYENQKEFDSLTHDTHYKVKTKFTSKHIQFDCNKHIEKESIKTFMNQLNTKKDWVIESIKERQIQEQPPKILITSTLQQKAHNLFKFSPKQTMKYAQELYENGYITYMRSDSACYSNEFIEKVKTHIIKNYGDSYLHKDIYSLQDNKTKNKSQEAHEGIRICDLTKIKSELSTKGVNILYDFIYKHSIQCAMSAAIYKESKFEIPFEVPYKFIHSYKDCIFRGWTLLNKDKEEQSYVNYLTTLYHSKTPIDLQYAEGNEILIHNKFHYHEASLIQKLESMNIGRPSTYANIIQSVLDKKYVLKENIKGQEVDVCNFVFVKQKGIEEKKEKKILHEEKNKLHISPLGIQVSEFCYNHFKELFNYDFTNNMENKLDEIEWGNENQKVILNNYITIVDKWINHTKEHYRENPNEINKVKDQSLHCGKYKNEPIFIKNGKYGYYICIGKKDKISLKEFDGFCLSKKISQQEELSKNEYNLLIQYVENRSKKQNESLCVVISDSCSIRESKYGYYIFYKTKSMKQPRFLKYNDEKDDKIEERQNWIKTKNKKEIKNYIMKKYNISI